MRQGPLQISVRTALKEVLGRALGDNEVISVRAYQPHEAASIEEQRTVASDLGRYFAEVDEKTNHIPETEREEILDEALRNVRARLPVCALRITLDSTILVRANHLATGPARALPLEILNRDHRLVLSSSPLEEVGGYSAIPGWLYSRRTFQRNAGGNVLLEPWHHCHIRSRFARVIRQPLGRSN